MGFRVRHSVRLFPGVRLNFSGGGISTTIGGRGASVNIGHRGTYLNLGLPGTGLSYRTRILPDTPRPEPARVAPQPQYEPHAVPGLATTNEREIRSADVSVMTSPGLGELKKLINEASAERGRTQIQVAADERALREAERKLFLARLFLVRLFTRRLVSRLTEAVDYATAKLADTRAHLEGCGIDIDFAFEQATAASYAALFKAFEELRVCGRIWDITSAALNNRFAQRTIATYSVTRKPVSFGFSDSELIRTKFKAMRLGNVTGLDIHIYPGFVMMRGSGTDFALIELRELSLDLASTNFLEEEGVPSDSQVVGHTWRKANKDGSRDRRFNNNYQIPLALYGELMFKSPTGLLECYMVSNSGKTQAFASALRAYQKALADLAARSKHAPAEVHQLPPPEAQEPQPEGVAEPQPVAMPEPSKNMALDWIALAVIVVGLAAGGYEAVGHREQIVAAFSASADNLGGNVNASPQHDAKAPAGVAPSREMVYVQKTGVNVRSEPSASASIIRSERKGARLRVFGRQGHWMQVGDTSPVGWVYSPLLGPDEP
ncbi:MAG TPA: DUF4236 domain-containing protein [Steroidobacteraceae bacterium]|nr:DUF4236 domain-containing protein [Steroidobacteraceae bacterium]